MLIKNICCTLFVLLIEVGLVSLNAFASDTVPYRAILPVPYPPSVQCNITEQDVTECVELCYAGLAGLELICDCLDSLCTAIVGEEELTRQECQGLEQQLQDLTQPLEEAWDALQACRNTRVFLRSQGQFGGHLASHCQDEQEAFDSLNQQVADLTAQLDDCETRLHDLQGDSDEACSQTCSDGDDGIQ
ncbi:MAG: hypothetical protein KDD55_07825 [Bdellovibrionales bacterium]|nr:hypothetical protein [Bdellovibrionales bacterium]